MATQYVDRAFLDFDGIQVAVTNFSDSISANKNRVSPMVRKNRASGYASGVPEISFTCDVPMPEDGFDINFRDALRSETLFTATVEYKGGQSITYLDCVIDSFENASPNDDTTSASLTVLALDTFEG